MIVVQSPLKRDFIISLLDGNTIQSVSFKLVKQEGMNMYFEHSGDGETAAKVAKETIKKSEFGPALFFRVTHE
ncbi:MAG: hypothetical protein GX090_00260 [Firmicutes bacterium]|nr:hypothetical protein [Bacillota bacterium]HOB34614.1 hypothetical protein [Bacillota bacterium]HPZ90729.1 hypothetical protein [Bacillota bacterium]HQE02594.1 hypothetical protein [Bacillota bacterium]